MKPQEGLRARVIKDQKPVEKRPRATWKRQETSHLYTRGREFKAKRA